jgi:hypothetical protein
MQTLPRDDNAVNGIKWKIIIVFLEKIAIKNQPGLLVD